MQAEHIEDGAATPSSTEAAAQASSAAIAAAAIASAALAACGGGGDDASSGDSGGGTPPPPPPAAKPTAVESSRFLAQASMGADETQIARVQAIGYSPGSTSSSRCAIDRPLGSAGRRRARRRDLQEQRSRFRLGGLAKAPGLADTLRQRVTLALSEIWSPRSTAWSEAAGRRSRRPTTSTCSRPTRSATTAR